MNFLTFLWLKGGGGGTSLLNHVGLNYQKITRTLLSRELGEGGSVMICLLIFNKILLAEPNLCPRQMLRFAAVVSVSCC